MPAALAFEEHAERQKIVAAEDRAWPLAGINELGQQHAAGLHRRLLRRGREPFGVVEAGFAFMARA